MPNNLNDEIYLSKVLPGITVYGTSLRQEALSRSRNAKSPNTNFDNAWDLNWIDKLKLKFKKGHTCINTVTGFYNPNHTTAGNVKFINNPNKSGFREIKYNEALPGDIIVLSDSTNHPNHAVMFDSITENGDTLVNYSNGGHNPDNYKTLRPLKVFQDTNAGGDFSGVKRYYRTLGKSTKTK